MVELKCLGGMRARERVGANVSGASESEVDWCVVLWVGRERIRVKPDCALLLPSTGSSLRSCVQWTVITRREGSDEQ